MTPAEDGGISLVKSRARASLSEENGLIQSSERGDPVELSLGSAIQTGCRVLPLQPQRLTNTRLMRGTHLGLPEHLPVLRLELSLLSLRPAGARPAHFGFQRNGSNRRAPPACNLAPPSPPPIFPPVVLMGVNSDSAWAAAGLVQ